MRPFKHSSFSPLWFAVAALAAVLGWCRGESGAENYLCEGTFALCTSAPCVPLPNSGQAACSCEVLRGKSMASVPCDQVAPTRGTSGTEMVYSMFSLAQFAQGKEAMTCAKNTPWTWCLNKPCTVDPADPDRALCVCDIITSSTREWMTLGGRCDASTCQTAFWSGASLEDFEQGSEFMKKNGQSIQPRWCE
ncbi:hypothetical protein [Nannocystis sp. SCPEA4]|uniref:hypothetical protein n=1 Tax=Nannocystis sp. SCPEA4 TaxID=2996787 RepID=UPI00226ECE3F|nr:hypothetical protein [Nannocystis sp. SCPEA4]MCY1059427.1 hypothetical protein [Nannocystis sp. SCPEA4]